MDSLDIIRRAQSLPAAIGAALEPFGGILRCETCRRTEPLGSGDAGRYTGSGWPKCCGYTMHWWTQRQIDAGEMPAADGGADKRTCQLPACGCDGRWHA